MYGVKFNSEKMNKCGDKMFIFIECAELLLFNPRPKKRCISATSMFVCSKADRPTSVRFFFIKTRVFALFCRPGTYFSVNVTGTVRLFGFFT